MSTIFETTDSDIDGGASGTFTINFGDIFSGTIGDTDTQDGINLPTLDTGVTYTLTMTVDDIDGTHGMTIINPNDFHSFGYTVTDGVPDNPGTQTHPTGFVTLEEVRVSGNTIQMDFTLATTQWVSLAIASNGATVEAYEISLAVAGEPTEGNDDIVGTVDADAIDLLGGDDLYSGDDGRDTISGGAGDDTIRGDAAADDIDGGAGDDVLFGGGGIDIISGDDGIDRIYGGPSGDSIYGGAGDDRLAGQDGHDLLDGGDDNDLLLGGKGSDTILGGAGDDELRGEGGNDTLNGGEGNDILKGGVGISRYVFDANSGNDTVTTFMNGFDSLDISGHGIFDLAGLSVSMDGAHTVIDLGGGNSVTMLNFDMTNLDSSDFIFDTLATTGTSGDDTMTGTAGEDYLDGLDGDDVINGLGGVDHLVGSGGRDTIDGGGNHDLLEGGADNDLLLGRSGNDTLDGGAGNDMLYGHDGNDLLYGGAFKDTIDGGDGNDTIYGGTSIDNMTGGAGDDVFVFEDTMGDDYITDFGTGTDIIDLSLVTQLSSFADLTLTQVGSNLIINIYGGYDLTLVGTNIADVDASDFLF